MKVSFGKNSFGGRGSNSSHGSPQSTRAARLSNHTTSDFMGEIVLSWLETKLLADPPHGEGSPELELGPMG